MIVTLHFSAHPMVLIAFCREEDVLLDNVAKAVLEQNEGDFVGYLDIVGLEVNDGLAVGTKDGNLDGTLLGAMVGP